MFSPIQLSKASDLIEAAKQKGLTISSAESCTGGLVAGCLTDIAGASAAFDRGYVTYSNAAKRDVLGVETSLLERFGAVSEEVARAMAVGALRASGASVAVAITGIAGPSGGSKEKPVGLVHFAVAYPNNTKSQVRRFGDIGRDAIRSQSIVVALDMLLEAVQNANPIET